MAIVIWVHNLIYRLVFGLVRFGLGMIWRWVLVIVALLGEEVRRYAGLALSGTIIVLLGKLTLAVPLPEGVKRWAVLFILVVLAIWAGAVRRAVRYTRHNNLMRMRQKQSVRDLHKNVNEIRGRVTEGLAQRTRGTPLEMVFPANRSARAEEHAAAEEAAAQAAADQAAAAEQDRRDRASSVERDRELESLGAEHNPFE